jgi:acyl-CoA thioester hydrolase
MQMSAPIYSKIITIPASVIDENGHANNVTFLQWMQDIAIEHYSSLGGLEAQKPFGTWFIREHKVEYVSPAFSGEEIEVRTWVENIRRVQSQRKYEFVRKRDGKTLVKGETEWVFVDTKIGRPLAIPKEVRAILHPSALQGPRPAKSSCADGSMENGQR